MKKQKKYYNYIDRNGYSRSVATLLSEDKLDNFIRSNENLAPTASLDFARGRLDGPYDSKTEAIQHADDQDRITRSKYN